MFSFTRSLAIALFKYNYIGDNPLLITRYFGDNILLETEDGELHPLPYEIRCLDYLIKSLFPKQKVLIHSFLIAVDDYISLDNYLKYYTGIGRKRVAAVEKDFEIIAYNPRENVRISNFVDAVYILYALQLKFNFLRCNKAKQYLIRFFDELNADESEKIALGAIVEYLSFAWIQEKNMSNRILNEKIREGRVFPIYDAYTVACEIISDDFSIEEIWNVTCNFPMDKVSAAVWKAFEIYRMNN